MPPLPGSLRNCTSRRCASMISRAIESPRPAPPAPVTRLVDAIEAIKQPRIDRRHADARVVDPDNRLAALFARAQCDAPARRGVLDGIVERISSTSRRRSASARTMSAPSTTASNGRPASEASRAAARPALSQGRRGRRARAQLDASRSLPASTRGHRAAASCTSIRRRCPRPHRPPADHRSVSAFVDHRQRRTQLVRGVRDELALPLEAAAHRPDGNARNDEPTRHRKQQPDESTAGHHQRERPQRAVPGFERFSGLNEAVEGARAVVDGDRCTRRSWPSTCAERQSSAPLRACPIDA